VTLYSVCIFENKIVHRRKSFMFVSILVLLSISAVIALIK